MGKYLVIVPVAGHASIEVEADGPDEAEALAFEKLGPEHLDDWEFLQSFHDGNVCYCPSPWGVVVEDLD